MAPFLEVAGQLRWQDVVDVAILTFVLFKAYGWLRGTVAFQVAAGMLTLVAAAFAARAVGLVLTGYVLQTIGAVAVLVAVVIFRDEIRRGLGRASPLRWWRERRSSGQGADTAWAPLCDGLFQLARRRIGALVVLPRADGLGEQLTGGTPVDALISPQLLEAIFHHGSPIHDGALVVERDRARLAGAFLPLSRSLELPEHLGTRHRAAVGVTEACDAIAVVVSEERGEVSLAVGGRIDSVASASALARRVDDLLRSGEGRGTAPAPGRRAAARGRGRMRDLVARAAIVVTVLGAWYAVAGERGSVITRSLPVELVGVPAGATFEPPRPEQVTLQLRGPRRLLLSMAPADLRAAIDLAGAAPGTNDLAVAASAPPGVEIVRVDPPRVAVEVLERRALPVSVQLEAGFPRHLKVRAIVPSEVALVGRPAAFRGVEGMRTRPVAAGVAASGMATIELVPRAGLQLADERERSVLVLFDDQSPAPPSSPSTPRPPSPRTAIGAPAR